MSSQIIPTHRSRIIAILAFVLVLAARPARAQMDRDEMLAQIAKLQLFISQTEKGYQLVRQGLTTIGDIKQGDFSLHQLFFTSLQVVSPEIRSYLKIADILTMQASMLSAYHAGYEQVKAANLFSAADISYINSLYQGILGKNNEDILELTGILTDGNWQMNDAQRLSRISHLYESVNSQYQSLLRFNDHLQLLTLQKKQNLQDLQNIAQLIHP
ncbi:MAG TPA: hypothetical protein VHE34_16345 [Puia sp.]|jgi:hypothetical protein|uniref:hypothetical protein n=1 Tax=Puia sp. TaxID=2045100 RepID=UPI0009274DD9|nr:hypothetical protein [Puia sp.]MBN8852676.1 hypothetical protein [Sphingobacteriales bacterium]OJW55499.1 MAG: hypothetical protein BGO55_02865 [Sphingobacteriales bacterium 50-39]HVU96801.1 hypothetical protein [Puia sp.]